MSIKLIATAAVTVATLGVVAYKSRTLAKRIKARYRELEKEHKEAEAKAAV